MFLVTPEVQIFNLKNVTFFTGHASTIPAPFQGHPSTNPDFPEISQNSMGFLGKHPYTFLASRPENSQPSGVSSSMLKMKARATQFTIMSYDFGREMTSENTWFFCVRFQLGKLDGFLWFQASCQVVNKRQKGKNHANTYAFLSFSNVRSPKTRRPFLCTQLMTRASTSRKPTWLLDLGRFHEKNNANIDCQNPNVPVCQLTWHQHVADLFWCSCIIIR